MNLNFWSAMRLLLEARDSEYQFYEFSARTQAYPTDSNTVGVSAPDQET
jgi:hypothetical protein